MTTKDQLIIYTDERPDRQHAQKVSPHRSEIFQVCNDEYDSTSDLLISNSCPHIHREIAERSLLPRKKSPTLLLLIAKWSARIQDMIKLLSLLEPPESFCSIFRGFGNDQMLLGNGMC